MIKSILMNERKSFYAALLLFVFSATILYPFMQYAINPDGISYITIARKYAAGNFADALNAYWGPLYSMILSLLLLSGLPEILSARFLQLLLGVILFFLIKKALQLPQLEIEKKNLLYLAFIPVSLYFVYWFITPDLLLALLVFWYTILVLDPEYENKPITAICCGLLGGLAFLAKSYGLFFFLIHFTLINFIFFLGPGNKKKIVNNYFTGVVVLLMIALAWSGLLSAKYGFFTLGTSAEINMAYVGPEANNQHLQLQQRILQPPNKTAISAWEDPSFYPVQKKWNPVGSAEEFKHQISLILINLVKMFFFIFLFSPLLIILFIIERKFFIKNKTRIYLAVTALIYPLGYLILYIETRYIWFTYLVVLIITFSLFSSIKIRFSLREDIVRLTAILLMLSLISFPVYALFKKVNAGKDVYALSQELKKLKISGNFACDTNGFDTHYLAYFLDSKFCGEINKNPREPEFLNYLKNKGIDYFFLWNTGRGFKNDSIWLRLNDENSLNIVKIR